MLTILSPAKSLDIQSSFPIFDHTFPLMVKDSQQLIKQLHIYNSDQLKQLMKISKKLAELNWTRYQKWHSEPKLGEDKEAKQAILMFAGDVYRYLHANEFTDKQMMFAQNSLCILSGLYGILRPLDLILPYRLEMGTPLSNDRGKNLYDFWQDRITNYFNKKLVETSSKYIINLASVEYAQAIDRKKLKEGKIIDIIFKEYVQEQYKIIGILSKRARGAMARYIITHGINKPEDIKNFTMDHYHFDHKQSTDQKYIFIGNE